MINRVGNYKLYREEQYPPGHVQPPRGSILRKSLDFTPTEALLSIVPQLGVGAHLPPSTPTSIPEC